MTKRLLPGVILAGVAFSLTFFQNCSGDGLPSNATDASLSSSSVLQLQVPNAAMGPDSTMNLVASGGAPPYTFSVLSGPVTVSSSSGTIASARTAGNVSVRVTDSVNAIADGSFSVDLSLAPVTAGSLELVTGGTTPFTIPAYNTLTVEAWGAGGGGGGLVNAHGQDGLDGGASRITGTGVTLTAEGGKKGQRCQINVSNGKGGAGGALPSGNGVDMAGAAAVDPVVSISPLIVQPKPGGAGANGGAGGSISHNGNGFYIGAAGTAPGGGGGGAGFFFDANTGVCLAGSGGGGAYLKSTYARGALTVGASLSLVVGAGGAAVADTGSNPNSGSGAVGKIKIVWN